MYVSVGETTDERLRAVIVVPSGKMKAQMGRGCVSKRVMKSLKWDWSNVGTLLLVTSEKKHYPMDPFITAEKSLSRSNICKK